MATSQQLYETMLQHQRNGMTYGRDDRLIAAVQSGEMSVEEAFPPTGPSNPMMTFGGSNLSSSPLSSSSTSPNVAPIAFNDPRVSTTSRRPTDPVDPTTVLATGGMLTLPAAQPNLPATKVVDTGLANRPLASDQLAIQQQAQAAAQAQADAAAQEEIANQNFLNFLSQLGLANLLASFGQDSTAPTAPGYQPQGTPYMGAPHSLVPQGGLMTTVPFGVAPVRLGYVPPKVINSSSVASDTGLLEYLLKG